MQDAILAQTDRAYVSRYELPYLPGEGLRGWDIMMTTTTDGLSRFKTAWSLRQIVCRPKLGGRLYEEAPLPDHEWNIPAFDVGALFDRGSPNYLSPSVRALLTTSGLQKLEFGATCLPCQEFLIGYHESSLDGSVIVRTVLHIDGSRFVFPSYQTYTDEWMADEYWLLFPYFCIMSGQKTSVLYDETSDVSAEEAKLVSKDWEKVAILLGLLEHIDAEALVTIRTECGGEIPDRPSI
jgi:hypothetical protein